MGRDVGDAVGFNEDMTVATDGDDEGCASDNAPLGAVEGDGEVVIGLAVTLPSGMFLEQVDRGAGCNWVFSMSGHLASIGRDSHVVNASGSTVNDPPNVLLFPAAFHIAP